MNSVFRIYIFIQFAKTLDYWLSSYLSSLWNHCKILKALWKSPLKTYFEVFKYLLKVLSYLNQSNTKTTPKMLQEDYFSITFHDWSPILRLCQGHSFQDNSKYTLRLLHVYLKTALWFHQWTMILSFWTQLWLIYIFNAISSHKPAPTQD